MSPAYLLGFLLFSQGPASGLKEGVIAFRTGDYAVAIKALAPIPSRQGINSDYALYFLAESRFFTGDFVHAEKDFSALEKMKTSRFAAMAKVRRADCLWMQGKHADAASAYQALPKVLPDGADPAVRAFRLAEFSARSPDPSRKTSAAQAFLALHVEFPGHPLGTIAGQKAKDLGYTTAAPSKTDLSPEHTLERAAKLSKAHQWKEAEEELATLPAALPPALAAERDYQLGLAKYQSRSDYAGAADLLFSASTHLDGDKAAFAAFHSARALSRLDRDDEAIARYQRVVRDHPNSKWTIEAQFRSGWLDFNRGKFRESLSGLEETLRRYPKSSFADDAAWYVVLAHYFLDEHTAAMNALTRYERTVRTQDGGMRACYFRARLLQKSGDKSAANQEYQACATRSPLSYYGLLAHARLTDAGLTLPAPPRLPSSRSVQMTSHPVFTLAQALAQAGLEVEAGFELARAEKEIIKRLGRAKALPQLLVLYSRYHAHRSAQRLAESQGANAFPGQERLYTEALYPKAFAEHVERHAEAHGLSPLFVYSIMRKESGYYPFALSSADARGLLQLLPSTAEDVAKSLHVSFYADELFDPEQNIALGSGYLGGLLKRFAGQEAFAAGGYNAGGKAMARWLDQWGKRPFDEFIELITYDQAREYIKRVLGIYAHYRHLYATPLELRLTLDPRPDPNNTR